MEGVPRRHQAGPEAVGGEKAVGKGGRRGACECCHIYLPLAMVLDHNMLVRRFTSTRGTRAVFGTGGRGVLCGERQDQLDRLRPQMRCPQATLRPRTERGLLKTGTDGVRSRPRNSLHSELFAASFVAEEIASGARRFGRRWSVLRGANRPVDRKELFPLL